MSFRGYVSSRHLDGHCIPQRVQNLVIRDYATKNDLAYSFSAVEYNMPKCYMILKELCSALEIKGVIFYSVHQILDGECPYGDLFKSLFEHDGVIHFALEGFSIDNDEALHVIKQLDCAKSLSQLTNLAPWMQ